MAGYFRRLLSGRRARASAATDRATEQPGPTAPEPTQPRATEPGRPEPEPTEPGRPGTTVAETAVAAEQSPSRAAADPVGSAPRRRPLIFGQVTETGNSPLIGATVTLTDLSGQQLDRDSSDSDGNYRLALPTGGSYLVICASAAHQPTAGLVAVADEPVRHDIKLSGAAASLSGTVSMAETGQPLTSAIVTLVDIHGNVVGAVSTEADGRYSFLELAQGHYTLTVAAPALQPVARSVEVPGTGHVTHDVEVAARVQLVGVVRTATTGAPVSEALITLITSEGQVVASAITDAEGGFVFDDLDTGVYTVIATGYPPVATEVKLDVGALTETVIPLRPPTLADAVAGEGAAGDAGREAVGHGGPVTSAVGRSPARWSPGTGGRCRMQ